MNELVIIERSDIVSIADSVRNKTGQNKELTIGEMIDCINDMGSGGIDTSDATATSDDILAGETAYVNGNKITGTFTIDDEITTQDDLIARIQTAIEGKAANTGTDTYDATATAEDIAAGKTAYVKGSKIVGVHECPTNIPELIKITWETTKGVWSTLIEDAVIDVDYIGTDESGNIKMMKSTGSTGEILCVAGYVHFMTNAQSASFDVTNAEHYYPLISSITSSIDIVYGLWQLGGMDSTDVATMVTQNDHLIIECN
jgi:hypothetical protein